MKLNITIQGDATPEICDCLGILCENQANVKVSANKKEDFVECELSGLPKDITFKEFTAIADAVANVIFEQFNGDLKGVGVYNG